VIEDKFTKIIEGIWKVNNTKEDRMEIINWGLWNWSGVVKNLIRSDHVMRWIWMSIEIELGMLNKKKKENEFRTRKKLMREPCTEEQLNYRVEE